LLLLLNGPFALELEREQLFLEGFKFMGSDAQLLGVRLHLAFCLGDKDADWFEFIDPLANVPAPPRGHYKQARNDTHQAHQTLHGSLLSRRKGGKCFDGSYRR
jgi:hypothetical protein